MALTTQDVVMMRYGSSEQFRLSRHEEVASFWEQGHPHNLAVGLRYDQNAEQ